MRAVFGFVVILAVLGGCSPRNPYSKSYLADRVKNQAGYEMIHKKEPGKFDVPPGVELADGLSEDEAVRVALWNNAQLQTDLVGISFADADIKDAGIIPNPFVQYLIPNGGIVAQGYIYFYIDALWQRPHRVGAAKRDAKKMAESLVQRTYVLIRDVQVAYADLALARKRVDILQQNASLRTEMSRLANSRLQSGDISELEATTARVDSIGAADNLMRAAQDTTILRLRLNWLLGVSKPDTIIRLTPAQATRAFTPFAKSEFLDLAYSNHPEMAAANASIEAAGERIGWERSRIWTLTAVLNGQNFAGTPSAENAFPGTFNGGFRADIPIFNQNQGRISRAKAEFEQAAQNYVAVRQRIAMDASEAYARYELAFNSYKLWNTDVLPALEQAVKLSQNSYASGDVSYLPVLEATRQMLDAQLRIAEVQAELQRAVSQLNFRMGKKILNQ